MAAPGPPMLLLHGNPNNHVLWYAVAARLAQHYHVVLADLRGYGDSSLPEPGPNLVNYSFRVMAEDMIEVMESLGHQRFFLVGHDRGARLSHRLCLDHPDRVMKLCLLDMLPNYHVWTNANMKWAIGTWHWLFMAQPEPFPGNDDERGAGRVVSQKPRQQPAIRPRSCSTNTSAASPRRQSPARAATIAPAPTIDFAMDTADKDRQIGMPLLILWGTRGAPPTAGISHGVAQVRKQSRRCAAAPDRPLPAGRSARPSLSITS